MVDEEDPKEYRWETGYEKTWEAIQEDEDGLLSSSLADIIQKAKRKRYGERKNNSRLGMMRHLFIVIDCSESMNVQDLKPTRQICTIKVLEGFVNEFFDQNPISQIGIITTRNKRSEKLSELAGNSRKHIKLIESLKDTPCVGEPSLQNALELSLKSLRLLPSHASREVLIIMSSLTTCDPGNLLDTIQELKLQKVRVSVIGLAAEVRVCSLMCKETGGIHSVILDDCHFRDQLFLHVEPPPAATSLDSSLIKMGFPHHMLQEGKEAPLSLCMCHLDVPEESKLSSIGYFCPQCGSKYCELPVECRACGLPLVSAPHLARSYHHLFPVARYNEIKLESDVDACYACRKKFSSADVNVYECETCKKIFCLDCDLFIHDTLHTCCGCANSQNNYQNSLNR